MKLLRIIIPDMIICCNFKVKCRIFSNEGRVSFPNATGQSQPPKASIRRISITPRPHPNLDLDTILLPN